MFDIGFTELILVSIVGLLVLGPERLPGAIRTASLWVGKIRRSFNTIRADIEREMKIDEIKQDLHNDAVMESLKQQATLLTALIALSGIATAVVEGMRSRGTDSTHALVVAEQHIRHDYWQKDVEENLGGLRSGLIAALQ